MKTTIINLFAGPGSGKSTLAAKLFVYLKERGEKVEYVSEYVKSWAWTGRIPKPLETYYIFAKQFQRETQLYGKVKYIITDSPFLLGPVYERLYNKSNILSDYALSLYKELQKICHFKNFFVCRTKPYYKHGRYQSKKEAENLDIRISDFLSSNNINFEVLNSNQIFSKIKNY